MTTNPSPYRGPGVSLLRLALTPEDIIVETERRHLEKQGLSGKKTAYSAERVRLVVSSVAGRVFEAKEREIQERFADRKVLTIARDRIKRKHPMDLEGYLNYRFSQACQKDILTADEIILFPGTPEELATLYKGKVATLYENPTSTRVAVFIDQVGVFVDGVGSQETKRVVFFNIFSESRINNTLEIIKAVKNVYTRCHPKETRVVIRGNIARDLATKSTEFAKSSTSELSSNSVLVVGARKAPSAFYQKSKGYDLDRTVEFEGFKYDILKKEGSPDVMTLRMPNGDLAYHAVRSLLKTKKFSEVIMVGAGGGFPGRGLEVGAYSYCDVSKMGDEEVDLTRHAHIIVKNIETAGGSHRHAEAFTIQKGKNVTVSSPLEEDAGWLSRHKDYGNVDVETFHIFKAIVESKESLLKVTPGVFISDVLGEHPLTEKIGVDAAWQHMEKLLAISGRAGAIYG